MALLSIAIHSKPVIPTHLIIAIVIPHSLSQHSLLSKPPLSLLFFLRTPFLRPSNQHPCCSTDIFSVP